MIQLIVLISLGHFKQMSYDQLSFPTILSLFWLNVNVPIQEPNFWTVSFKNHNVLYVIYLFIDPDIKVVVDVMEHFNQNEL